MKVLAMAQSTPELASCLSSGEMSCKNGESGASGELPVQNQDDSDPPRLAPQNFVWRLARRSPSVSSDDLVVEGEMAVDVPVLRECFDPWRHDRLEETGDGSEGRCRGCSKIPKARVIATTAPHVRKPGESLPMCMFISICHNPHACGVLSRPVGTCIRSIGTRHKRRALDTPKSKCTEAGHACSVGAS